MSLSTSPLRGLGGVRRRSSTSIAFNLAAQDGGPNSSGGGVASGAVGKSLLIVGGSANYNGIQQPADSHTSPRNVDVFKNGSNQTSADGHGGNHRNKHDGAMLAGSSSPYDPNYSSTMSASGGGAGTSRYSSPRGPVPMPHHRGGGEGTIPSGTSSPASVLNWGSGGGGPMMMGAGGGGDHQHRKSSVATVAFAGSFNTGTLGDVVVGGAPSLQQQQATAAVGGVDDDEGTPPSTVYIQQGGNVTTGKSAGLGVSQTDSDHSQLVPATRTQHNNGVGAPTSPPQHAAYAQYSLIVNTNSNGIGGVSTRPPPAAQLVNRSALSGFNAFGSGGGGDSGTSSGSRGAGGGGSISPMSANLLLRDAAGAGAGTTSPNAPLSATNSNVSPTHSHQHYSNNSSHRRRSSSPQSQQNGSGGGAGAGVTGDDFQAHAASCGGATGGMLNTSSAHRLIGRHSSHHSSSSSSPLMRGTSITEQQQQQQARHLQQQQQLAAAAEGMLDATRIKMGIPVLRRHLVESLKTNTKAVRKYNSEQQQHYHHHHQSHRRSSSSSSPMSNSLAIGRSVSMERGGGGGGIGFNLASSSPMTTSASTPQQHHHQLLLAPPAGDQSPPADNTNNQQLLGESLGRSSRSIRGTAVSFTGGIHVTHSVSSNRHIGGGESPSAPLLASINRRGTVEAALIASTKGASRNGSLAYTGNSDGSPTSSSSALTNANCTQHATARRYLRPIGPLYDPSDATDPALVTKRAPEWLIAGHEEDPSALPAMQRYLSIKSRQRRERIVAEHHRTHPNGEGEEEEHLLGGGRADRLRRYHETHRGGGGTTDSVDNGMNGGGRESYSGSNSPFSSTKSPRSPRTGGGGEATTQQHVYRGPNGQLLAGLVPSDAPLGLDHHTLAKMAAKKNNSTSNANGGGGGGYSNNHTINSLAGTSPMGATNRMGQQQWLSPFNSATQNGSPSDLLVEGGGAAFVSSVAYNSPYVQRVLAPLLKQTREREKILENTDTNNNNSNTATMGANFGGGSPFAGRTTGGNANSAGQQGNGGVENSSFASTSMALAMGSPAVTDLFGHGVSTSVLQQNLVLGGGGPSSSPFSTRRNSAASGGGGASPIGARRLSIVTGKPIVSPSAAAAASATAILQNRAQLAEQDRLVAAVLLEEMDRKKKALLAALDDDIQGAPSGGGNPSDSPPAGALQQTNSSGSGNNAAAGRRDGSVTTTSSSVGGGRVGPTLSATTTTNSNSLSVTASGLAARRLGTGNTLFTTLKRSSVGSSTSGGGGGGAGNSPSEGVLVVPTTGGGVVTTNSITGGVTPAAAAGVKNIPPSEVEGIDMNQLSRPLLSVLKEKVTQPMIEEYELLSLVEKEQRWLLEPHPSHDHRKGVGRRSTANGNVSYHHHGSLVDSSSPLSSALDSPQQHPARTRALEQLTNPDHFTNRYDSTAMATRHLIQHRTTARAAEANANGPSASYLYTEGEMAERQKKLNPHRNGGLNAFIGRPTGEIAMSESTMLLAAKHRSDASVRDRELAIRLRVVEDEEDIARRRIIMWAAEEAQQSAQNLDAEFEQENRWRRQYKPRRRL